MKTIHHTALALALAAAFPALARPLRLPRRRLWDKCFRAYVAELSRNGGADLAWRDEAPDGGAGRLDR